MMAYIDKATIGQHSRIWARLDFLSLIRGSNQPNGVFIVWKGYGTSNHKVPTGSGQILTHQIDTRPKKRVRVFILRQKISLSIAVFLFFYALSALQRFARGFELWLSIHW